MSYLPGFVKLVRSHVQGEGLDLVLLYLQEFVRRKNMSSRGAKRPFTCLATLGLQPGSDVCQQLSVLPLDGPYLDLQAGGVGLAAVGRQQGVSALGRTRDVIYGNYFLTNYKIGAIVVWIDRSWIEKHSSRLSYMLGVI